LNINCVYPSSVFVCQLYLYINDLTINSVCLSNVFGYQLGSTIICVYLSIVIWLPTYFVCQQCLFIILTSLTLFFLCLSSFLKTPAEWEQLLDRVQGPGAGQVGARGRRGCAWRVHGWRRRAVPRHPAGCGRSWCWGQASGAWSPHPPYPASCHHIGQAPGKFGKCLFNLVKFFLLEVEYTFR
jgi:hypothetical protein